MSLAVRTLDLTGEYFLDISRRDVEERLKEINFKQDKNGNWIPPKELLDHSAVKNGRITLPANLHEWHPVHYFILKMPDGSNKKLIRLLYYEKVLIRYGKYEFVNSKKFYNSKWFPLHQKIYKTFLNAQIKTLNQWLEFPFKVEFGPPFGIREARLDSLPKNQSFIRETLKDLADKNSDIEDKESFLETVADVHFKPKIIKDKYKTEHEIFELVNWKGVICYELFMEYKNNLRINTCETCKKPIYLVGSDHSDRRLHRKDENLECWKAQQRSRKRKQRRK